MTHQPLDEWAGQARAWLAERLRPRQQAGGWGEGSDDVSVFHSLTHEEEGALLTAIRGWQREKFEAGYGAITWPLEYGGAGLAGTYARVFRREEAHLELPGHHEVIGVSLNLVANTIRVKGDDTQRERFLRRY